MLGILDLETQCLVTTDKVKINAINSSSIKLYSCSKSVVRDTYMMARLISLLSRQGTPRCIREGAGTTLQSTARYTVALFMW